jgi:hypothetical protein
MSQELNSERHQEVERAIAVGVQRVFSTIVTGIALFALSGCASYPRSGSDAVVGKWTNSRGTLLKMRGDYTFTSMTRSDMNHVWGSYTIAHHAITFRALGGDVSRNCRSDGLYHFRRISAEALQFSVVSDKCKTRRRDLVLVWHRSVINAEP